MSISRLHDSVSHQYSSHMPVVKFGSNIWLEETLCLDFSMCVLLVCVCVCVVDPGLPVEVSVARK